MTIPEKLNDYLNESPSTWNEVHYDTRGQHILDYAEDIEEEDRYLSGNDLKAIEKWVAEHGKLPVLGRVWSGNSSADYPLKFQPNGYACGGYSYDGVNNTSTVLRIEGSKVVEADRSAVSELLAPDQLTDYLCFPDLETCREALLEIILFECGVKSGVEKCSLWGYIFIADLPNACSYYGKDGGTIYPPNIVDADTNESRVEWLEENGAIVLSQKYEQDENGSPVFPQRVVEQLTRADNKKDFPEIKGMAL